MLIGNRLLIDALQESERALGKPEQWFFSCTILSNLLSEQGESQLAHLWKSLARRTDINRSNYHIFVGSTYIQLEDWEQAIHHNKEAIAIDDKLALGYSNLAKLYEKLGQPEDGLPYLYKFMSLRPEQSSAERCEELGTQLLEKGEAASAIDCYRWAIQNEPEQWTAYYRIAHILTCAKQPERAIRYYQLLLERDASQVEAHQKLGKLFMEQQQYIEAIEHFQAAIAQKSDFNWGYFGLAQAFLAVKQWDDVIDACQKALQINQEQQWPYQHMAKAWLAQGQLSQAQSCWQKIAALEGWKAWGERGYDFTYDAFTHKIRLWLDQLQTGLNINQRNYPLSVLQIGGAQGMWSCWMLDCVLAQTGDTLSCLAYPFSNKLQLNLDKVQSNCSVSCSKEEPIDVLLRLNAEHRVANHDLIYIQRCRDNVSLIYETARLSWSLLKDGGMMVFQNYEVRPSSQANVSSTKSIIDKLLNEIEGEFQILHQSNYLFIKKQSCNHGSRVN